MGDAPAQSSRKLRLMTYLAPGVPVTIFELIRDYLEEKLDMNAYLIYESRWSGPSGDRPDPFTNDEADIVFLCSTSYLQMKEKKNKFVELCQAAPLHSHPMSAGRPVYFSDLVINQSNKWLYKDFHSLKGCRFAYNDSISLSGNVAMLAELKKFGYNANFFGSSSQSGSHHNSIKLILNGQADVAAIDSNTMTAFALEHPELAKNLHTITSLGPLPIYPVVFNSRLPAELKSGITQALLDMGSEQKWGQELLKMGVTGFTKANESDYKMESDIRSIVKNMTIVPAYY